MKGTWLSDPIKKDLGMTDYTIHPSGKPGSDTRETREKQYCLEVRQAAMRNALLDGDLEWAKRHEMRLDQMNDETRSDIDELTDLQRRLRFAQMGEMK
jgi:hypothetical protein